MTMREIMEKAAGEDIIAILATAKPEQLQRLAADILRSTHKAEARK